MAVPREIGVVTSVFVTHLYRVAAADNPCRAQCTSAMSYNRRKKSNFPLTSVHFPLIPSPPSHSVPDKNIDAALGCLLFFSLLKTCDILPEVAWISEPVQTLSKPPPPHLSSPPKPLITPTGGILVAADSSVCLAVTVLSSVWPAQSRH